ncbi:TetR/AcrR family transcriptional regulator [Mycobacterium sp.]|uniref:TetR/AcrR family transcriptional regulator n=1 Tax=Mycobacterium sp. TaxID=1785 RepID=UPI002CA1277B|nr:TetR/AcrR family transcriptional regulator [Mycobacterium sp.]HKP41240.1 TetR/AcrR family transcriptional regulator [Mycobacterium sp.]
MTQSVDQPATRRDRNAEATRQDILNAALEIFVTQPYSGVSGMQICTLAGVTRGALQHHFGSKLGLFMAVFEKLQQDVVTQVLEAVDGVDDAWNQASAGIAAFLQACTTPAYQAVVLKEGPAAIGWQRWRELDVDYFSGIVETLIDALAAEGLAQHPPVLLAALIRGTLTELSFEIARSDDHQHALNDALSVIRRLLDAFRITHCEPHGAVIADVAHRGPRIGVGQLRSSAGMYIDQAAAGQCIEIVRRGKVVAQLGPSGDAE